MRYGKQQPDPDAKQRAQDAKMLKQVQAKELERKQWLADGKTCGDCRHLKHCAKKPATTDPVCICWMGK